ncbi:MAG: DUF962 domain-containing protein [Chitinophagaceae bacterium]|nr:DUF962 domain-containing protein [Chitinophagaceae bacterium]MCW5913524.1 DUF962 domain-containing protein [Chitinophagaceae bacterium]MCZ2395722.1 DUF962 domain-containing protein [Chitinophagales bacterium]
MKSAEQWLSEYGQSHQNPTNKLIHWICVPSIFLSIIGFLYSVKIGANLNLAYFALIFLAVYYFRLSFSLGVGMLVFAILCLGICYLWESSMSWPLWIICAIVFVVAWIGQFYGHGVEGKKPSFLKDLQFLLIGPMWLMSFVYRKMGIKF